MAVKACDAVENGGEVVQSENFYNTALWLHKQWLPKQWLEQYSCISARPGR
jgi:hypothetical protein